jgi:hypothetical protein
MFRSYSHLEADIFFLELTRVPTILTLRRRKTPLTRVSNLCPKTHTHYLGHSCGLSNTSVQPPMTSPLFIFKHFGNAVTAIARLRLQSCRSTNMKHLSLHHLVSVSFFLPSVKQNIVVRFQFLLHVASGRNYCDSKHSLSRDSDGIEGPFA